jgi:hypothetical protein
MIRLAIMAASASSAREPLTAAIDPMVVFLIAGAGALLVFLISAILSSDRDPESDDRDSDDEDGGRS